MEKFLTSRHRNFYIAIVLGLIVGAVVLFFSPSFGLVSGVNVFFLTYLALTGAKVHKLSAAFLRQHAIDEDEPAVYILLVMLATVTVSAISLFLVVMDPDKRGALQLSLGVASIVLGWFAVHTMWALHYAFEYYLAPAEERKKGKQRTGKVQAGLGFPGEEEPNGVAFFYFSYVIGMTAQTSDTEVTASSMRRLVLLHSVFSFFFNTVLVAAAVNITVTLAQ